MPGLGAQEPKAIATAISRIPSTLGKTGKRIVTDPGAVRGSNRAQRTMAGRQPAAIASVSLQNQRLPCVSSIVTWPYQGLHGM